VSPLSVQTYCILFHILAAIRKPFINPNRAAVGALASNTTVQSYVGMTTYGSNGGIAYQPGICGAMQYRAAVVKSGYSELNTAQVM